MNDQERLTDEQEASIEALSLMHGFAAERPARLVDTAGGLYAVEENGDVQGPVRPLKTGFRRLQREVYGPGATA